MGSLKKASDEVLVESYIRLGNIWKVAKEVGMCGQSVWERLKRLNSIDKTKPKIDVRKFKDYDILEEKYVTYRDRGELNLLAKELGRTVPFLCRKAGEIGLTTMSYPRSESFKKKRSIISKEIHKKNGHPRGMLGKSHSQETCNNMSKRWKAIWDSCSKEDRAIKTRTAMDAKLLKYGTLSPIKDRKLTWKQGWRTIDGINYYFRSSWEYIYALSLQNQKTENKITDWKFEPKTFTFEKELLKVTYYTPDFEIITLDGSVEYHEVKGWMDERSILKLSLMKKWYPEIKIVLIQSDWFKKNVR